MTRPTTPSEPVGMTATRITGPVYPMAAEGAGHIVRRALLASPTRRAGPEYMRELNLLIVLDAFRIAGQMSRASVARATGLSAPTASKSVQQLVDVGLLVEQGRESGNIGKPATKVSFNAAYGSVLGIDLGGTHLRMVVSDLAGRFSARCIEVIDASSGPDAILGRIEAVGRELLAQAHKVGGYAQRGRMQCGARQRLAVGLGREQIIGRIGLTAPVHGLWGHIGLHQLACGGAKAGPVGGVLQRDRVALHGVRTNCVARAEVPVAQPNQQPPKPGRGGSRPPPQTAAPF